MKKLLSVILAMAMLLSMSVVFTSCGDGETPVEAVNPEDIKKNPVKYLGESFNKATEGFMSDDAGIDEIVAGALNGGSVNVKWEATEAIKEMTGMPQLGIDETLYFGKDFSSLVSDTKLNVAGEEYTAMLYITTSLMAIGGSAIGGDTYKLDVFNFDKEFADSSLAELLGEEFVEMYSAMLGEMESFFDQLEGQANMTMEEYQKRINRYISALKQTVTVSDDSVVISYVIDGDSIEALVKEVLKDMPDDENKAMIEESLPQIGASFDMLGLSMKLDINVSVKTGAVSSIKLYGSFGSVATTGGKAEIEAKVTFSADAIKAALEVEFQGETLGVYFDMDKKTEGDSVVYTAKLNVKAPAGVLGELARDYDILKVTYTYDKKSGNFELKAGITGFVSEYDEIAGKIENSTQEISANLKGSIKKNGESATITLDSVGAMGVSIDIGAAITFNKTATAPAIPENAKDILDITQADLEKLMESPIFQLFLVAQPNQPEEILPIE
ncbi:MAG: hypothetical protein IJX46_04145 [Clostridia bacterium]|nr:hypothetical protein [Clostridia bacterium]